MFALTTPCGACPFRTDIEPFLRKARASEIVAGLMHGNSFTCHKSLNYDELDDDDRPATIDGGRHCAGAAIMLQRIDRPNQVMQIGERLGQFEPGKLNMRAPVFKTFGAFIDAQEPPKKARKKKGGR